MSDPNFRKVAQRATGKPAKIACEVVGGDGDTTLNVPGIELGDVVITVLEFNHASESEPVLRGAYSGTVTGNGTVTAGSAIQANSSCAVLYYDFDAS